MKISCLIAATPLLLLAACGDDSGSGGGGGATTTSVTTGTGTTAGPGATGATTGAMTTGATTSGSTSSTSSSSSSSSSSTSSSSTSSTGSTSASTSTGMMGIMSCADVCAAVAPIEAALPCPTNPNCEADCVNSLSQFPQCESEYYVAVECVVQAPLSSWTCDQGTALLFSGPECQTEIDDFILCVNP